MSTIFFTINNKPKQCTKLMLAIPSIFFSSQIWAANIGQNIDEWKPESSIIDSQQEGLFGHGGDVLAPQGGFFDFDEFNSLGDSAEDFIKRGLQHFRSGYKEQGIKELEKGWSMAPNQLSAGVALAYVYLQDRQYQQAIEVAKKLKKNLPEKPHGFIVEGLAYQGLNDKEQSKAAFKAALKVSPGEPTAIANLADYALSEKDVKQARDLYINALKHNPVHIRTLSLLARLDASLGKTEQTEELIITAIQKSPDTLKTHNEFAQVYEQLKKYPLAIQEIEKSLKIDPNNAPTLFMHARLLASDGQFDASRDILSKLSLAYPNKPESRELEGKIALAQNKPEEAVKLFQEALNLSDSKALVIQLATAQMRAGETDAGLATIRNRLDKSPADMQLRAMYAELLRKHGKLDEARKEYAEILGQQPGNIGVRNNFAWLLAQKGELDEALSQAKQAHDGAPTEPNVMDTYGVILLKKQQYEKAEALFKNAAEKLPDNPAIRFHWAQSLAGMTKNNQAEELLKQLLAQDKDFEERQQAEQLLSDLRSR